MAQVDPNQTFAIDGANVGYLIAKQPFNNTDQIDGS
jgi:hypothetical protein